MSDIFKSVPIALKMIFKDPINLFLAFIPALIAAVLYLLLIYSILNYQDELTHFLHQLLPHPTAVGHLGKILTVIFIIFSVFLMSWTYVLAIGIFSAPFNSMLSSRIERKLTGKPIEQNRNKTLKSMASNIYKTFEDEFLKLFFIIFLTILAFVLNLFPFFYPLGILILSLLVAVQFVDYSWQRHNLNFKECLRDLLGNIFTYAATGFIFLVLITVPLINTLIPAIATSYFTVLWLKMNKRLP